MVNEEELLNPHPDEEDDSSSEQESDSESQETHINRTDLIDKNGHEWSMDPPVAGRRGAKNVIHAPPGPRRSSQKDTILETHLLS